MVFSVALIVARIVGLKINLFDICSSKGSVVYASKNNAENL